MAAASPPPSVVSVEPAVVRQIVVGTAHEATGAAQAQNPKSSSTKKDAVADKRARKRPSQDGRRGADGAVGAVTSQESFGRPRNNSLRHVKNSKELLRERSVKRAAARDIDAQATSKEGRNFTVGNVGTGGLIYLR
jgi:hypothetical protein